MTLHRSIMLDGDPARVLSFGCGLVIECADTYMSAERAEQEKAALEKEQTDLEAAQEAERRRIGNRRQRDAQVGSKVVAACDYEDKLPGKWRPVGN